MCVCVYASALVSMFLALSTSSGFVMLALIFFSSILFVNVFAHLFLNYFSNHFIIRNSFIWIHSDLCRETLNTLVCVVAQREGKRGNKTRIESYSMIENFICSCDVFFCLFSALFTFAFTFDFLCGWYTDELDFVVFGVR